MTPLNGTKTHPLTEHARLQLASLRNGPRPCNVFNAGTVDRLKRNEPPLVELVDLPSPYPSHKGRRISHLKITAAGLKELAK